ncbi:MAG TPA: nucleotide exchange factor GrpE [Polyangiaceae bacterium]|nr:nucleotide exchange factor GrpE [Polyangiaceae bacterium]
MSDEKVSEKGADHPNGASDASPNSADEAVPASPSTPPEDPLARAQAEAARLKDQLLRLAADFDNFKKRSRKEVEDLGKIARENVLRELLPVFDNLERATSHASGATDVKALTDGISMVTRQFLDTLGKLGIERVPALGLPFDPAVHEAVQHLETTEYAPGTVAMELQAGYRMGDRVIRPAMVVVAKPAPS